MCRKNRRKCNALKNPLNMWSHNGIKLTGLILAHIRQKWSPLRDLKAPRVALDSVSRPSARQLVQITCYKVLPYFTHTRIIQNVSFMNDHVQACLFEVEGLAGMGTCCRSQKGRRCKNRHPSDHRPPSLIGSVAWSHCLSESGMFGSLSKSSHMVALKRSNSGWPMQEVQDNR